MFKDNLNLKGKFKAIKTDSKTGEVIYETPYQDNLIMNGTDTGFNLVLDRLYGTNTYSLNITHLDIGTSNTTPAISDLTLGTAVARAGIATKVLSGNQITYRFFFADGDLPNDDYGEVGMYVDGGSSTSSGQIFSHALFSTTYTKSTGEDTTIEYIISKG